MKAYKMEIKRADVTLIHCLTTLRRLYSIRPSYRTPLWIPPGDRVMGLFVFAGHQIVHYHNKKPKTSVNGATDYSREKVIAIIR